MAEQQVEIEPELNVSSQGNVAFIDGAKTVTPEISPSTIDGRSSTIEGAEHIVADELMGRWTQIDGFEVLKSHYTGVELKSYNLPSSFRKGSYASNSNMFMILRNYAYYRADVELKFVVNANRFQVGQLQVSAYYAHDLDANYDLRNNIYARSQMMHQLISLQNNKPVTFTIPFAYPKQFLRTRDRSSYPATDFAQVKILVLNPLRIPDNTYGKCKVAVYARLTNVQVSGMVPNSLAMPQSEEIADHQMMSAIATVSSLMKLGEQAVNLVGGKNRDSPRDPRPDTVVIPRQSSSWAIGKFVVNPSNVLRLDSRGIAPEPTADEMQVGFISQRYGLAAQATWTSSHSDGAVIWNDNVAPITSAVVKVGTPKPGELQNYQPTPVAVVSSNFAYWRGSLKYRFDFIASFLHTGRVVATFYPSYNHSALTVEDRSNLVQVVFDLEDAQSFTFEVPFIWDKEWCTVHSVARANADSFPTGTGRIALSVVNSLIPNDSISNTLDINIYVCAGEDFEVAVPVNPELSLSWDPIYRVQQDSEIRFRPGYGTVGVGVWRYFWGGKAAILRYGDVADHVAQIDNGAFDRVYSFSDNTTLYHDNTPYSYFVCPHIYGDPPQYLAAFTTLDKAKNFLAGKDPEFISSTTGPYKDCSAKTFKTVWNSTTFKKMLRTVHREANPTEELDLTATHQGEDMVVANPVGTHSSLSMRAFGEDFGDLKDLIRRYQYYSDFNTIVTDKLSYGSTLCRIPLTFAGLKIDPSRSQKIDEVQNRMRHGVIPVLASGFRFFSGSMRVRVIVTSSDPNLFFQVMHVPELTTSDYKIEIPEYKDNTDFITTGYAGYGQSLRLNQLLDVEIPYYLPGKVGLLQRYASLDNNYNDTKIFSLLGCLEISCMTPIVPSTTIDIRIFFAGADDTRFINFTGFPPMNFPKQIPAALPPTHVHHDLELERIRKYHPKIFSSAKEGQKTFLRSLMRETVSTCENDSIKVMLKDGTRAFSVCLHFGPSMKTMNVMNGSIITTLHIGSDNVLLATNATEEVQTETANRIAKQLGLTIHDNKITISSFFVKHLRTYAQKLQDLANCGIALTMTHVLESILLEEMKSLNAEHEIGTIEHESEDVKLTEAELALMEICKIVGLDYHEVRHEGEWWDIFGLKGVTSSINKCASDIGNASTIMANKFSEIVSDFVGGLAKGMGTLWRVATMTMSQILQVLNNPTPFSVAVAVSTFFIVMAEGMINGSSLFTTLIASFSGYLSTYFTVSSYQMATSSILSCFYSGNRNFRCSANGYNQQPNNLGSLDSNISDAVPESGEVPDICSTLISLCCLMGGISKTVTVPGKFFSSLFAGLPKVAMGHSHLLIFIKNVFSTFSSLYEYIYSKFFPYSKTLEAVCGDQERLKEWATDASYLVDPFNEARVLGSNRLIAMTHKLHREGLNYRRAMIDKTITGPACAIVRQMCDRLEKSSNAMIKKGLMQHIRFEPMVVQIVGEAGIGKSRLIDKIGRAMLKEVGVVTTAPFFYKTTNSEWWNGVNTQPICVYDDFMAYSGPQNTECIELYQLKSCAPFNPPLPDLEDKKLWYNPLIVILSSNNPYPKTSNLDHEPALWRRRDFLVQVELDTDCDDLTFLKDDNLVTTTDKNGVSKSVIMSNSQAVKQLKATNKGVLERSEHLKFSRFADPIKEEAPSLIDGGYDAFMDELLGEWKEYYNDEIDTYMKKTHDFLEDLEMDAGIDMDTLKKEVDGDAGSKFFSLADHGYQLLRSTVANAEMETKESSDSSFSYIPEELTGSSLEDLKDEQQTFEAGVTEMASKWSSLVAQNDAELVRQNVFEATLNQNATEEDDAVSLSSIRTNDFATPPLSPYEGDEKECVATFLKTKKIREKITCAHHFIDRPDVSYLRTHGEKYGVFEWADAVDYDQVEAASEQPCKDDEDCPMNPDNYRAARFILNELSHRLSDRNKMNGRIYAEEIPRCFDMTIPERTNTKTLQRIAKQCDEVAATNRVRDLWKDLKDSSGFKWISDLKTIGALLASVVGVAIALVGAYQGVKYVRGSTTSTPMESENSVVVDMEESEEEEADFEHGSSGDHRVRGSRRTKNKEKKFRQAFKDMRFFDHHEGGNSQALSDLSSIIQRNSGTLTFHNQARKVSQRTKFLGICGRYIYCTKHFFEFWISAERPPISLRNCIGKAHLLKLTDQDFSMDPQSSVCVIKMPKDIPSFKDLRNHIANYEDHNKIPSLAYLHALSYESPTMEIHTVKTTLSHSNLAIAGSQYAAPQDLELSYKYNFHGPGKCGSVLISSSAKPLIIGLHVAGNSTSNIGYAQPLVRHAVKHLQVVKVSEMPIHGVAKIDPECTKNRPTIGNLPESELLVLGTLDKNLVPHLPEKTQMIQLPTQGEFHKVLTEPSVLTPKDPRLQEAGLKFSPLQEGVKKHALPPIPFHRGEVRDVADDILEKLIAVAPPCFASRQHELLTDQEIIGGIPGEQGYKAMDLSTSEGYPLQLLRPKGASNKRWLINVEETHEGNRLESFHPLLAEEIEKNMTLRKKDVAPNTIFVDALKDCPISKEKVLRPGATRIFSASPLEFTLATKKYFGHFQGALVQNRIKDEVCVGINADGTEWREVVEYLHEVSDDQSPRIVTGDYSHYGDSLQSDCLHHAFRIMIGWYSHYFRDSSNHDENQRVRNVICEEFLHVQHLAGNTVYKMFCGLPSGFALTVELNSLVNMMYMRLAWKSAMKNRPNYYSLARFNQLVRLLTYGDDLIMSVSPEVIDYFNFRSVRDFLARYDIAFTHSSKKADYNESYESLKEATFLKRGFVPHPRLRGEWLAPLPDASIYSQLDWGWKTHDVWALVWSNMRSALNGAYSRGEKYHSELRSRLMKYAAAHDNVHLRAETWDEIDNRVFSDY